MNPMVRKELRQRMRERRAWLLPTLYLLGTGIGYLEPVVADARQAGLFRPA